MQRLLKYRLSWLVLAVSWQLSLSQGMGAPANDNYANRSPLSGSLPIMVTTSSVGATLETGEPSPFNDGASVWWTFTCVQAGNYLIDTVGSTFDTTLAIYSGTVFPGSLVELAKNDDGGVGSTSSLSRQLVLNQTIQIRVAGFNSSGPGGSTGTVALNLKRLPPPPANDNFANAIPLGNASVTVTGSNVGATLESSEPNPVDDTIGFPIGGSSVWWTWTAPSAASVFIETTGSSIDTVLAVYTGTAVGSLTQVAVNDDAFAVSTSAVQFTTVAGRVYRIAVHGYESEQGAIALTVRPSPSWAQYDAFLAQLPAEERADSADWDKDLFSNFAEFTFGLNPTQPSTSAQFMVGEIQRPPGSSNDYFYLTLNRRTPASGPICLVVVSDDLVTWDRSGAQLETVGTPVALGGGLEQITYRVPASSVAGSRKYIRVEVFKSLAP